MGLSEAAVAVTIVYRSVFLLLPHLLMQLPQLSQCSRPALPSSAALCERIHCTALVKSRRFLLTLNVEFFLMNSVLFCTCYQWLQTPPSSLVSFTSFRNSGSSGAEVTADFKRSYVAWFWEMVNFTVSGLAVIPLASYVIYCISDLCYPCVSSPEFLHRSATLRPIPIFSIIGH